MSVFCVHHSTRFLPSVACFLLASKITSFLHMLYSLCRDVINRTSSGVGQSEESSPVRPTAARVWEQSRGAGTKSREQEQREGEGGAQEVASSCACSALIASLTSSKRPWLEV